MYTELLTVRIDGLDINLRSLSNDLLGLNISSLLNCVKMNYCV